ncbi:MAG: glycosyltransferase family 4 protein [Coriobacteriia bacterium]|nr:glycosyltransferase family 4 protein [Coriobacteriia bacterium]
MTDLSSARIVFVDNYPHASVGGGEQHLLFVADACRAAGADTHVVCTPGSGLAALAAERGHVVVPLEMSSRSVSTARRMRAVLGDLRPSIVHFHGFYVTVAGAAGAAASGARAVLTTVHTMPSAPMALRPGVRGRVETALRTALTRRAARSIDRFVCVVDAVRLELEAAGVSSSKLVTIHNGIPVPEVGAGDGAPRQGPSDGAAGGPLVGSVGRFEAPKGYEGFIDAAALVCERVPDARFRLVGDGSLRDSLQGRADAAGLGERITFPGWSDTPLAEIEAMDVYVASSVTDTTNLTVLEAMALGKPAVVTRVGGLPEVVADGVTGYVVPPRDVDALAGRIVELLEDAAMRDRMGEAARARFLERFTAERMAEEHLALYESLLGR